MRAATNQKIISAAVALFSDKGFAATGVQEIAGLAGISIGLLYRHYKTKDDIFAAIVQLAIDGLREAGGEFDGEPAEVIRWWTKDVLNDMGKDDEFVQFMNVLSPTNVADESFPGRKEIMESHFVFQRAIAELIERGQAQGVFRDGCPLGMAQFFLTIIGGICSMKLALKEKFIMPTPEMVTAYILKEEYNVYE